MKWFRIGDDVFNLDELRTIKKVSKTSIEFKWKDGVVERNNFSDEQTTNFVFNKILKALGAPYDKDILE